ncbi:MAG TPA: molecular chaperone DnaJ [Nitrososphaerales archaeon]|nr:molecular chaperone DnaJ [Nitrososphaerales archaeon]
MSSSSVKRDYYEVLGVSKDATPDQIKSTYRKLALQYHPDRNKSPSAEEKFKEISEAYAILSDDQKRAQYDQFGHEGIRGRYSQEDIFRTANFDDIFRDIGFGGGFDSIFDSFFGGGFGSRRRHRTEREQQRGEDLTYELDLTLEEIASGTTKEIEIPRNEICNSCNGNGASPGSNPKTCPNCQGTGQTQSLSTSGFSRLIRIFTCEMCKGSGKVIDNPCTTCNGSGSIERKRKLTVKIPPGIEDGSSLRLGGEGSLGEGSSGRPDDLYIVCRELPHKVFTRKGDDLYTVVSIDMIDAALGTEIPVPTIYGNSVTVKVPSGTQSGTVLRLKGMGIRSLENSSRRGDEFVTVNVTVPTKLTPKQAEILKKFRETERRK